jgi:hypothetical protein
VSVRIRSRGQEAVITGDLMHSPVQIAIPDRIANFDMDKPRAAEQRARFVRANADRPVLVIGSHFPLPTAGHIVSDGDTWRFTSAP